MESGIVIRCFAPDYIVSPYKDEAFEGGQGDLFKSGVPPEITEQGIERLKKSRIQELIVTDTVPMLEAHGFPVTVLSVAELLGEAILRIHENQSVTSLFKL